jgi:hypothetical protein
VIAFVKSQLKRECRQAAAAEGSSASIALSTVRKGEIRLDAPDKCSKGSQGALRRSSASARSNIAIDSSYLRKLK